MLADLRQDCVEDIYLSGPQSEAEVLRLAAVLDNFAAGAVVVVHLDDEASVAIAAGVCSSVLAAALRRGVRVALAGHSDAAALHIERLLRESLVERLHHAEHPERAAG